MKAIFYTIAHFGKEVKILHLDVAKKPILYKVDGKKTKYLSPRIKNANAKRRILGILRKIPVVETEEEKKDRFIRYFREAWGKYVDVEYSLEHASKTDPARKRTTPIDKTALKEEWIKYCRLERRCKGCGSKRRPGFKTCKKCRVKRNGYKKFYKIVRRFQGLCIDCRRVTTPSSYRCPICSRKSHAKKQS